MGHIEGGHRWQVVTPRIPDSADPKVQHDGGIEFVLTQSERSRVAVAKAHLERIRRDRNRADDARALSVALEDVA